MKKHAMPELIGDIRN